MLNREPNIPPAIRLEVTSIIVEEGSFEDLPVTSTRTRINTCPNDSPIPSLSIETYLLPAAHCFNTMRFVSLLLAACAVFQVTAAVNPGNNALNMGVSDSFEVAIHKECAYS